MHSNKQNFIRPERRDYKKHAITVGQILLIPIRLLPYLILLCLIMAILIGVFVGISLAPYYASLKAVYAQGIEGQNHLLAAEKFLGAQKFDLTAAELESAEQSFVNAQKGLKLAGQAAIFRSDLIKNQLVVAEEIFSIGEILSRSLKNITAIGQEIQAALKADNIVWLDITPEKKGEILKILNDSVGDLQKVQQDFALANGKLLDINSRQPLFIFNKAVTPLQTKIPKLQKTFDGLVTVAKLLPAFSGYPEAKTYLFILENNREMRPAGGFIGTYGILKIKNAEMEQFFTDNSYNFDSPVHDTFQIPSPEPMKKYMNQPHWYFRDSNWWPDFPTSAEKVEWFYHNQGGAENLDGIIAITPNVIEELLGVLGEFQVSDLKFNKENFWEQLQYQVEYGYYKQGIEAKDRKDIISDLGQQMIARLYLLPMNKWPILIDAISEQVKEKQFLLYFNDPEMQAMAIKNGWAGEVKDFSGDYIMLVDANLAALKTDSVMNRTMMYRLDQNEDGELFASTSVNYQNMGTFSWKTTRYRTYTRLYVPAGSELISVKAGNTEIDLEKDVDITNEFGKTAFGLFFEVEPQTSKVITWKYKLPARILPGNEYAVMVQKQPGIPQMNLQLDLNFQKKIKSNQVGLHASKNNLKHVEVMRQDQVYTVWLE